LKLPTGTDIRILGPPLGRGFDSSCRVVAAAAEPAGSDLTGELLKWGSYLRISGRLVPAILRLDKSQNTGAVFHDLEFLQEHEFFHFTNDTHYFKTLMGRIDVRSKNFDPCRAYGTCEIPPDRVDKDFFTEASLKYLPGWINRHETYDFEPENPATGVYCLLVGRAPRENLTGEILFEEPPVGSGCNFEEVGPAHLYFLVLRRVTKGGEPDLEGDKGPEHDGSYRYLRVGVVVVARGPKGWADKLCELGQERTVTIY